MAAQMQININSGISPDTKKLAPAQDVWESLQRRVSVDPSPPKVSFEPSPLDVEVGDQIFWTNNDSQPHWPGLKKEDGSIDNTFFMPNQIAVAADMGPSSSPTFSPVATGALVYACSLHSSEEGTIGVT
jgi:plastocyanin